MKTFIGLGSNLNKPIENLEKAAKKLLKVSPAHFKISPVYQTAAVLPDKAPRDWDRTYFNAVAEITWSGTPSELLDQLKKIETDMGRTVSDRWAPRIIDLDLLTFGDEMFESQELKIPHHRILERSFVLDPLKDLSPQLILPGYSETVLQQARKLSTHRPLIMAIANLTPDSFSDGGNLIELKNFEKQFQDYDNSGTQIIDLGAESTRPNATFVCSELEWRRLQPALRSLQTYFSNRLIKPLISIDTYKADVAKNALQNGIDIINDVSGLSDLKMLEVLQEFPCHYVLMHNLGIPANPAVTLTSGQDIVSQLKNWLHSKLEILENAKIKSERIIFDIGIGFGKSGAQSIELLERISEFKELPIRTLVGHSRKSFMKDLKAYPDSGTPRDRDALTLLYSQKLAKQGVDILRVHDFSTHMKAFV